MDPTEAQRDRARLRRLEEEAERRGAHRRDERDDPKHLRHEFTRGSSTLRLYQRGEDAWFTVERTDAQGKKVVLARGARADLKDTLERKLMEARDGESRRQEGPTPDRRAEREASPAGQEEEPGRYRVAYWTGETRPRIGDRVGFNPGLRPDQEIGTATPVDHPGGRDGPGRRRLPEAQRPVLILQDHPGLPDGQCLVIGIARGEREALARRENLERVERNERRDIFHETIHIAGELGKTHLIEGFREHLKDHLGPYEEVRLPSGDRHTPGPPRTREEGRARVERIREKARHIEELMEPIRDRIGREVQQLEIQSEAARPRAERAGRLLEALSPGAGGPPEPEGPQVEPRPPLPGAARARGRRRGEHLSTLLDEKLEGVSLEKLTGEQREAFVERVTKEYAHYDPDPRPRSPRRATPAEPGWLPVVRVEKIEADFVTFAVVESFKPPGGIGYEERGALSSGVRADTYISRSRSSDPTGPPTIAAFPHRYAERPEVGTRVVLRADELTPGLRRLVEQEQHRLDTRAHHCAFAVWAGPHPPSRGDTVKIEHQGAANGRRQDPLAVPHRGDDRASSRYLPRPGQATYVLLRRPEGEAGKRPFLWQVAKAGPGREEIVRAKRAIDRARERQLDVTVQKRWERQSLSPGSP